MSQVVAQAILRSPSGTSLLDATEPPDSADLDRYVASPESVEAAKHVLTDLGFTVADTGAATISFTGSRELFEATFRTSLVPTAGEVTGTTYWQPVEPIVLPEPLGELIVSVAFPIEPKFYK